MTKFTIEDLRDIAYRGSYDDLERELALQLLASMEQEPVAYTCIDALDDVYCGSAAMMGPVGAVGEVPLYAAPQLPQPSVPDEWIIQDAVKFCRDTGRQDAGAAMAGWNACRAAMLQAGNSPVIPNGWVMVPVEPTAEMVKKMRYHCGGYDKNIKDGYKAMLAAAPQQEVK